MSDSPDRPPPIHWGKKFFDAADAGSPAHPDIKKINVSATGAIAAFVGSEDRCRTAVPHDYGSRHPGGNAWRRGHIAPLNPWLHIYYAVTGINSFGDPVNAGQHLTREEAIRLFTRQNAWFLRMEEKIGTIETGKLADLVVLDRDYFSVPDAEIKKVRSALTMVDGKIVHNNGIG